MQIFYRVSQKNAILPFSQYFFQNSLSNIENDFMVEENDIL